MATSAPTDAEILACELRELPPRSTIVVRVADEWRQDAIERNLVRVVQKLGRSDITVIVLAPDVGLDVLDDDDMRANGWVRA